MNVIDASVWVAYFNAQDKFHAKSVEIIKSIIDSNSAIILPNLALIEVAGAIRRVTKSESLAQSAISLMRGLGCEFLEIDNTKLEPMATSIAIKYACRGGDACYIATAITAKGTLWTFDLIQKQAAVNMVAVG